MRWPLDPGLDDLARAWWALPEPRPEVAPRPAATVVLLRDRPAAVSAGAGDRTDSGAGCVEAFVLHRHVTMRFAPGMIVFPGGGLDPTDPTIEDAAVRELFEESGVLLAADGAGSFPDTSGPEWEQRRLDVAEHRRVFTDVLVEAGLRPRTDLLRPWSRWVTPRYLPRRYDTWFFLARLPAGQRARHVEGEAQRSGWASPATLLATDELMQPTRETLRDLAAVTSWAELPQNRSMAPQLSELVEDDGELYLEHEPPDTWRRQ